MGSLDPAKILVVLVIALVVLGPERLPKAAHQLGSALRELTRIRQEVTDEVRSALPELDDLPIHRIPSVRGTLTQFITDSPSDHERSPSTSDDPAPAAVVAEEGDGSGPRGEFVPPPNDPSMN